MAAPATRDPRAAHHPVPTVAAGERTGGRILRLPVPRCRGAPAPPLGAGVLPGGRGGVGPRHRRRGRGARPRRAVRPFARRRRRHLHLATGAGRRCGGFGAPEHLHPRCPTLAARAYPLPAGAPVLPDPHEHPRARIGAAAARSSSFTPVTTKAHPLRASPPTQPGGRRRPAKPLVEIGGSHFSAPPGRRLSSVRRSGPALLDGRTGHAGFSRSGVRSDPGDDLRRPPSANSSPATRTEVVGDGRPGRRPVHRPRGIDVVRVLRHLVDATADARGFLPVPRQQRRRQPGPGPPLEPRPGCATWVGPRRLPDGDLLVPDDEERAAHLAVLAAASACWWAPSRTCITSGWRRSTPPTPGPSDPSVRAWRPSTPSPAPWRGSGATAAGRLVAVALGGLPFRRPGAPPPRPGVRVRQPAPGPGPLRRAGSGGGGPDRRPWGLHLPRLRGRGLGGRGGPGRQPGTVRQRLLGGLQPPPVRLPHGLCRRAHQAAHGSGGPGALGPVLGSHGRRPSGPPPARRADLPGVPAPQVRS